MKVCIDTTPITSKPSGVGLYILNLIEQLSQKQLEKEIELSLIYQPRLTKWLKGVWQFPPQLQTYTPKKVLPVPVRLSNVLFRSSEGLIGKLLTNYLDSSDIVHGTNYSVYPTDLGSRIMTIYDVSFSLFPEYATSVSKAYLQTIHRCLEWTDLIITISESSKQDIINCFNIPEKQVWVTPLASRYPIIKNDTSQISISRTQLCRFFTENGHQVDLNRPYILFVGTLEPRKNLSAIVKAFNHLKSNHKVDHQLLLVGQKGWLYDPILETIHQSPYKNYIYHLDYVSEQLIVPLYQHATVFVYPSHYEGFGLPVLEAMSLGCPVITSNTSSLPEVAGKAAILIAPDDIEALAENLYKFIDSPSLRQHYIQAGYRQAEHFSWERTAKSTIEAYYSLVL